MDQVMTFTWLRYHNFFITTLALLHFDYLHLHKRFVAVDCCASFLFGFSFIAPRLRTSYVNSKFDMQLYTNHWFRKLRLINNSFINTPCSNTFYSIRISIFIYIRSIESENFQMNMRLERLFLHQILICTARQFKEM